MRKALFLLIVTLLLLPGGALLAQDGDMMGGDTPYCGDLSEADCALFNRATEAPTSTAFASKFDVNLTSADEDITFGVSATGGYVIDTAQQSDAVAALADTTLLDFAVSDVLTLIEGGINTFDGELLITITPPAGVAPPMFESIPLNLWLVDGTGYIDLSPAEMFDPRFNGVYGMNLMDSIRFGLAQVTVGDITEALRGVGMDDFGDMGDDENPFNQALQNQVQLTPDEAEAFLDDVLTLSRGEDIEIDGETVATFTASFDVVALVESDVFKRGFALNTADQNLPFTADEFSAALVAGFVEPPVIEVTTYIGVENAIGYGFDMAVDFQVDVDAVGAAFGEDTSSDPVGVVTAAVAWSFLRSDVNALASIELPEGATVVTVEELIEMMNSAGNEDA